MHSSPTALLCLFFAGLAGGSVACSSDSDTEQTASTLAASGVAGGTASSETGAAGNGAGSGMSAQTPSPSGAAGAGSPSSEGPNVAGLANPGGGATSTPGMAAGGGIRADAGGASPARGVCPTGPFAASPLPAGATPQPICTGMTFVEGAVWFQELNTLFFSDFQIRDAASNFNGRILSYTPGAGSQVAGSQCQEFIANSGTNGLVIGLDGNLLGARHSDQTLTRFDLTTKQTSVLVPNFNGQPFNSPNDIAIRSDGNLYFTDPSYMLGNRTSVLPMQTYRRDPSGALSVIDTAGNPNGVTLSPDETHLYLSHLGGPNDVVVFDVDASGGVSNRQPFANVSSDGMAIDCAGNLYTTQAQTGVTVFDPSGARIGTLAAQGAANVAFGGPDRKTLFITATGTLFAVELAIPGLPY
jgi:gluconolactonase